MLLTWIAIDSGTLDQRSAIKMPCSESLHPQNCHVGAKEPDPIAAIDRNVQIPIKETGASLQIPEEGCRLGATHEQFRVEKDVVNLVNGYSHMRKERRYGFTGARFQHNSAIGTWPSLRGIPA